MVFRVGDSVEVYWAEEEEWFEGTIDKIEKKKGLHVVYEGRDDEWISLDELDEQGDKLMRPAKEERGDAKKKKNKTGTAVLACKIDGCSYTTHQGVTLRRHQASIHDVNVVFYPCNQKGCSFKAKRVGTLRNHQAYVHGVDVVFYLCDQEGCDFKAKQGGNLKRHLATIHDIGVKWHKCDQKGCSYKTIEAGKLRRHQANVHGL
jgi:hypothetical protein